MHGHAAMHATESMKARDRSSLTRMMRSAAVAALLLCVLAAPAVAPAPKACAPAACCEGESGLPMGSGRAGNARRGSWSHSGAASYILYYR